MTEENRKNLIVNRRAPVPFKLEAEALPTRPKRPSDSVYTPSIG
jgi:hypothetical protein